MEAFTGGKPEERTTSAVVPIPLHFIYYSIHIVLYCILLLIRVLSKEERTDTDVAGTPASGTVLFLIL